MPSSNPSTISEKRTHIRYTLPLTLFINEKGENGDQLCNISKGGACFQSPGIFNLDDFVLLHFSNDEESPLEDVKFSLVGRILRVDEKEGELFKYGIQFEIFNDPFSKQQYSNLISCVIQYAAISSAYRAN